MKRLWRWLFPETTAKRLHREALAVYRRDCEEKWKTRREWYEAEIQKAATAGQFSFNVPCDDANLFRPKHPGDRWARGEGLKVGLGWPHGYGFQHAWPTLRWSR